MTKFRRPTDVWRAMRLAAAIATCAIASSSFALNTAGQDRGVGRGEQNKRVVAAFHEAGLNQKDFPAASRYLGQRYVQHNPNASDGREGSADFIRYLRSTYPDAHSSIRQAVAEDDYVILHVLAHLRPGDRGNAIIDIFRLERGRIVEHWDVKQPIPEHRANPNGMF